jgi:serine-type D-Ala-D-Ala carboxypeptidase (penicillin-binding protein 5/6)
VIARSGRWAACLACALLILGGVQAAMPAVATATEARSADLAPQTSRPASQPSGIAAAEALLVNAKSRKWLWSRFPNRRHPIASVTKVMSAMVVLGEHKLSETIKVSQAAVNYAIDHDAGSAGLVAGDVLTQKQLLYALLLPSGADAAYMLAHTYRHGWKAFVAAMNATAKKLGMTRTHFANFDGLPWPTEYSTWSTPRDVIKLGEYAMRSKEFRKIVGTRRYLVRPTSAHHGYRWFNTNLLIGHYRGAIGIKTGFTLGAGYCLLFDAKRGKLTLMGVVLDSTNTDPSLRFSDARRLLNWGFGVAGPVGARHSPAVPAALPR